MTEHRIHQIFVVSVILKGLHALIECAGGILFYLVPASHIAHWIDIATQEELVEDPRDFVANQLLGFAQHLSVDTTSFYAFYLLSHGLVKVLLVAGLLKEKLWAYPLSLVVLACFVAYQLYRYSYTHSFGLIVLTVFDLFIMVLAWHEWHYLRTHIRQTG
ncbi:MAG: DUF2127 domain-containing protein [Salaquimonas sp.]|jgi:uncharacterized membrane protein|nr:DUF2127 domain-containing protein [Salaquimonas sp.]